jgi:protein subunit release factor B
MRPTTLLRPLLRIPPSLHHRPFTTTPNLPAKPLPPRLTIPETHLIENFLKGSGPGGQKINKTSSAVQLKHIPTGIVVKCQDTRSRSQNRKVARRLLAERIEELEKGEESRTAVKARERSKRKKSAEKKRRRKYKAVAAGKEEEIEGEEEDEEDIEGDGVEVEEAEIEVVVEGVKEDETSGAGREAAGIRKKG